MQVTNRPRVRGHRAQMDAASLESARQVIQKAMERLQAESQGRGLPAAAPQAAAAVRGPVVPLGRDACAVLVARARCGLLDDATLRAFVVFSVHWSGAPACPENLNLPSGLVVARWIEKGPAAVRPASKAAEHARKCKAVGAARAEIVAKLRAMQQRGVSLGMAMTVLLDHAQRGDTPDGLATRELLLASRDSRGGHKVEGDLGLPSPKSLWTWIAKPDLVPKPSGPAQKRRAWHDCADHFLASDPAITSADLHARVAAAWRGDWGAGPVTISAVYRYLKSRAPES